jgi:RNA polymerase sigma factor (sigma-70 family)
VDTLSYAALWAEHQPAARRVALALVPPDAADDIVSEAFARVLETSQRRGLPREFRPYLMAAVRHLATDYQVQRHRVVPVPVPRPPAPSPGAGDQVVRAEELAVVGRAFDSLPARWRAVLWQTEVEGLLPAELADASGLSANAVAQLAVRAREGLALAWERERGGQMRDTAPLPALRKLAARRHARRWAGHKVLCRAMVMILVGAVARKEAAPEGVTAPPDHRLTGRQVPRIFYLTRVKPACSL